MFCSVIAIKELRKVLMEFIKLNNYIEVAINYLPNAPYTNIHHYVNVGMINDYSYCFLSFKLCDIDFVLQFLDCFFVPSFAAE